MLHPSDVLFLAAAGLLAGIVGTAGGITSLISYPALLAVGASPLIASFTNIVAVVVCLPGAALASRTELRGRWRWLLRWSLVAMAAAGVGAALLLSTPAGVFERVVPFLLVLAALSLAAQPRLSAWQDRRIAATTPSGPPGARRFDGAEEHPLGGGLVLLAGVLLTSLYNGYFGAGAGVMTLALILFTVDRRLVTANAMKNVLVGSSNLVAAVAFAAAGHVDWPAAWPLSLGMLAGKPIGPAVARRVPPGFLRVLVALTGLGLACWFWATAG